MRARRFALAAVLAFLGAGACEGSNPFVAKKPPPVDLACEPHDTRPCEGAPECTTEATQTCLYTGWGWSACSCPRDGLGGAGGEAGASGAAGAAGADDSSAGGSNGSGSAGGGAATSVGGATPTNSSGGTMSASAGGATSTTIGMGGTGAVAGSAGQAGEGPEGVVP